MSDFVIRATGLSKQYKLGARERYRTLRDTLTDALRAPFRRNRSRESSGSDAESFWALKDVSFEVKRGEVLGIIGRNGAGKSTLLKILSRITVPTRGRAEMHGRVASLLEVGTGFHPELSGRDNIYLNGAILGMKKSEIRRKFDEIVDFAEVDKFVDTPVKHYSSGMYVRLAFAVAAHLEPEILVVDEVLAVGDAQFQKKCLGKLGEVSRGGRTVLFVSHNMAAMRSLCGRAIWLAGGSVVADGEPDSVIGRYLSDGSATALDRSWPEEAAARSSSGYLRRVRLLAANDEHMDTNTSIDFEFEYVNKVEGEVLNFSFFLNNFEDTCIFNWPSPAQSTPAGILRGRCSVPGGLLNDGRYRIHLMVVKETSMLLCEQKEALVFEVNDPPREGNWFGKWPGCVRPVLPWTMSTEAGTIPEEGTQGSTSFECDRVVGSIQ
ncbi:MAG TPA: polysaccharide ABC transporter ATP-binding protein [Bryobacteraceae bacterium]|jgi:lipopolysaccharide transport system ATP-binding protein|nr:polysaccharide ABC transporter ATP-binding protein [Bryobacteraceae bacterium]